ncbi:carboxypeptidase regulatory-like domain-containing protein [Longimicrobium sp.]|uniref:carboxypeptidase regulatory-like domain-containing protein n=1 Tax=Longimicrobium sp. TaxID=2029185 RepID=UPI002C938DF1|nr:carboxypeptidase regulatory-like domain-containing protein [Longimicrobium sp.]HSU14156.1 carboxypeptidase regulatory-like domain-containing protein [Longimicrobium sp.]
MKTLTALLLLAAVAAPAAAQTVRGELVDPRNRAGIGGAHVFLMDAEGHNVASALTTSSGTFILRAPAAGSFTVRAERIGFVTTRSRVLSLAAGQTVDYRMEADLTALTLAGITAQSASRCVVRPGRNLETARVWEEARKALDVTRTALSDRMFRFRVRNWSRESDFNTGQAADGTIREAEAVTDRPFSAVPLDTLRASGFIQTRADTTIYNAPDADVLLSDEFLDTHCFRIVDSSDRDTSVIGLAFEPVREGRKSDVRGTLWLSRAPVELRYLDYQYTRAPIRGPGGVPGGRVDFKRLPNGVWIASKWLVRMPIRDADPVTEVIPHAAAARQPSLVREEGGEVVAIDAANGAAAGIVALGTVTGTVYDSTTNRPLAGARVFISGSSYEATTDSAGVFEMRGVRPGRYGLSFSSPRLSGLGYLPAPVTVTMAEGGSVKQDLFVPSLTRVLASACPADSAGAVGGAVRSAASGAPVPGAVVVLTWRATRNSPARTAQAAADSAGAYHFCGIPAGAAVQLAASEPGTGSASANLRLASASLERRDLELGTRSQLISGRTVSTSRRGSARTRILTREEIQQSGLTNALDLLTHLRPEWNQMRGQSTMQLGQVPGDNRAPGGTHEGPVKQFPALYVDGVRVEYAFGDDFTRIWTASLRIVPASSIEKIEFLTGPEATLRFGTDSPNGAIMITTYHN